MSQGGEMVGRKEAAAAQGFRRRQVVAALRQGSRVDPETLRASPNRGLYAGVLVAVVALLASGAHGYLRSAPPDGWLADGHVVVDGDDGGRYLSRGGTLHPVPNETSLRLLTRGAQAQHVTVTHAQLGLAPVGVPIGDGSLPERPPTLVEPRQLVACTDRGGRLSVVVGPTSTRPPIGNAALAAPAPRENYLVTAGRNHQLNEPQLLSALTYTPNQVVGVSRLWLNLFTFGVPLQPLRLVAGKRGPTPTTSIGLVVQDADTSQLYVVQKQGLSLVRNRITALLLAGGGTAPVKVPHSQVVAAAPGPEFGYVDVPDALPVVPPATATGAVSCAGTVSPGPLAYDGVPAAPGDLQVATALPRAAGVPAAPVAVWSPPGAGLLVRATNAGDQLDDKHPDYLVADGTAHPVRSTTVLTSLGYQPEDATRVPPAWLALLPQGAELADLSSR